MYSNTKFSNSPADSPAVAEWLALRPPALRDYDSERVTTFLRTELEKVELLSEGTERTPHFMPERLIEVGTHRLRLVERRRIFSYTKQPRYAALSYCWGPPEDARTQSKNTTEYEAQFLESLDFETLSPVIKDAVKVTRNLSIPYLWVDSLCILQDDASDWQRQCSQMSSIYGKACITLIAATSGTCQEGFLRANRPSLRFPYQSVRRPDISGLFSMYFAFASSDEEPGRPSLDVAVHGEPETQVEDLLSSKWAHRGWTFQEEAMASTRALFGMNGMYFGSHGTYKSMIGATSFNAVFSVRCLHGTTNNQARRAWQTLTVRYSRYTESSFTHPEDLLPALSGLAMTFSPIMGNKYVAGHWMNSDLHHSLSWTQDIDTPIAKIPSLNDIVRRHSQMPYLVPSWSCLGRGSINYSQKTNKAIVGHEVTLLDYDMRLVGDDPYGAIREASLTLRGLVLDLGCLFWSNWRSPQTQVIWGFKGRLTARACEYAGTDVDEICFHEHPDENGAKRQIYFSVSKAPYAYSPFEAPASYEIRLDFQYRRLNSQSLRQMISRMKMLLLGRAQEGDRDFGYGLMLLPLEEASEPRYLRVGVFRPAWTKLHDEHPGTFNSLKRLMGGNSIILC